MNSSTKTKFSIVTLVLLVVPLILCGCLQRTILSEHGSKKTAKHVSGQITPSGPIAVGGGMGGSVEILGEPNKFFPIWFTRTSGENLVYGSQKRQAPFQVADPATEVNFVLKELLAGPNHDGPKETEGLSSEIPKGTKLIDVTVNGDQIAINLSREFLTGGGNDSFEARLEQIRRTVSPMAGNNKVYLNIEGKELTTSGDGLEVQQPINQVEGATNPRVN